MRFGIDFGTTRTVITLADRGNYPVAGFETEDGDGLDYYPTVVAAHEGRLVYGLDAIALTDDPDATVMRSFKRLLSEPRVAPDTPVRIGPIDTTILELVTGFFKALLRDLLTRSNLRLGMKPDEHEAVIATPANAHSAQRFITMEAARRAGLEVVAMMNEPSAAGVEYAHRHHRTLTSKRELVVVYDLGGGTFDASLVSMQEQSHDVLDSVGIKRLGGDDFDRILFDLALEMADIDVATLDDRDEHMLLEHCREQKERLHPSSRKVTVEIGGHLTEDTRGRLDLGKDFAVTIKVDRYYEACEPLVAKTMEILGRVLPGDIDEDALDRIAGVYVVGGASALPVVARSLREWFGRRVRRSPYPSASTAIGLAIAGDETQDVQITERLARSFGVFREAHSGSEVSFDPILSRDAELPQAKGAAKELIRRYRPIHNLGHFRYVECGWLDDQGAPAGDITPFAEVLFPFDESLQGGDRLERVTVERGGEEGNEIEERYSIDASGVVSVTIRDLDTGFEKRHQLGPAWSG